MIGPLKFWHIYCCHIFFSARILNMFNTRTTFCLLWRAGPPGLGFYGSGPARLQSWLEVMNVGRLGSSDQKFFWKWNLSFSDVAPPNRLPFYLGSPLHIIRSLFSFVCPIMLFRVKCWNLCLETLRPFLSECSFHWLQHCFHLKLFHEFLTFISSNIWR